MLALDVVLQARLVCELPLAGDALVDRRRGRVSLAVATLIQLLGVFSARRQLVLVLRISLPNFSGLFSSILQIMSLTLLMLYEVSLRVKKELRVVVTVENVKVLILMLSE